jgi:predicted transposase/invertase (TIGR01784 family)
MKTDTLFYYLFKEYPEGFFEMLGQDGSEAKHYTFKSLDLKGRSFRIDGVFVPKRKNGTHYLVEVQFQRDERFYPRVMGGAYNYLLQFAPTATWEVIMIFPTRAVLPYNEPPYHSTLQMINVHRYFLNELEPDDDKLGVDLLKLVVEPQDSAPAKAQQLARKTRYSKSLIAFIEQILIQKFEKLTRKEIQTMLSIGHELLKGTKVYEELVEEGLNKGLKRGEKKGIKKGVEQGRQEERHVVARRLLAARLPIDLISKTTGLSAAQVRRLSKQKMTRRKK